MNNTQTNTIYAVTQTESLPIEYGDKTITIGGKKYPSNMWRCSISYGRVIRVYLEAELKMAYGNEMEREKALNFNAGNFLMKCLRDLISG